MKIWNKGQTKWTQIVSSSDPEFMMDALRSVFSKECKTYEESKEAYKIRGQFILPSESEERNVEVSAKIYNFQNEGVIVDFCKEKGNSLDFNEAF